ncbi:MAG: flagellar hook basal-body protein [Desulfuromonas sp.]|nr:flagellar hook basal-body protein [Desulfuromonas sp.]
MSSGIYAALSGAICKMQSVEIATNNLANANSNGYKRERLSFSSVLDDATQAQSSGGINYVYTGSSKTDFEQGIMAETKNDLDVGINGEGYFKIRSEGKIYYTRLGNFDRRGDGTLVTRTGDAVLSAEGKPIVLPEGPITIDEQGSILSAEGEVGRLSVFAPDENLLTKQGQCRMAYSGDEKTVMVSEGAQLMQGHQEQSNVQSMEETITMMTSMRAFESYQKAMKNYFTIDSKAAEIGSL